MDKIASPDELAHELRALLRLASSENPSRQKIAEVLHDLAYRTAAPKLPGAAELNKARKSLVDALKIMHPDVSTSDLQGFVEDAVRSVSLKARAKQR